jgi:AbrB family looped-hinge helix DNA binding protein
VNEMAVITKIDQQGRISIPSEIRKLLKLEPNMDLEITIIRNELIIKISRPDLKAQVEKWMEDLINTSITPGISTETDNENKKWMDNDYIEKKLGLY